MEKKARTLSDLSCGDLQLSRVWLVCECGRLTWPLIHSEVQIRISWSHHRAASQRSIVNLKFRLQVCLMNQFCLWCRFIFQLKFFYRICSYLLAAFSLFLCLNELFPRFPWLCLVSSVTDSGSSYCYKCSLSLLAWPYFLHVFMSTNCVSNLQYLFHHMYNVVCCLLLRQINKSN